MFKLPWSDLPPVNKELLEENLNKMHHKSQFGPAFIIYLPITVYEHIKAGGINAHFIELCRQASPGMVWVEVRKIEKLCGKEEECFEEGACWGHLAKIMCKHLVEEKGRNSFFCKKTKERVKISNIYLERYVLRNACTKEAPDIPHTRVVADALNCLFHGQLFSVPDKTITPPKLDENKPLNEGDLLETNWFGD